MVYKTSSDEEARGDRSEKKNRKVGDLLLLSQFLVLAFLYGLISRPSPLGRYCIFLTKYFKICSDQNTLRILLFS